MEQKLSDAEKMKRADAMITDQIVKPQKSWPERFQIASMLLVFLIGAIGGGLFIRDILNHFHAPFPISDIVGLVFWCAYGLLISKIELKSDQKSNYDRGYSDGYASGSEEGLYMGTASGKKGEYDRGYQSGLLDGRADGWDYGYECSSKDHAERQDS